MRDERTAGCVVTLHTVKCKSESTFSRGIFEKLTTKTSKEINKNKFSRFIASDNVLEILFLFNNRVFYFNNKPTKIFSENVAIDRKEAIF